jgi:putative ATP-dependent endonuclease of OLD family
MRSGTQHLNCSQVAVAERRKTFQSQSDKLTTDLKQRIDIDALTTLITDTGAEDGGMPHLSGALDETDIIYALNLFIKRSGMSLPATFNGLGYNNLVYISLLLASMYFESDYNRRGQNALVFPMLVLEEPEAHLHPALQYKLLRFIRERQVSRCRQVFLTTHSTHVTAAAELDSIICMSAPTEKDDPRVSYPGKVFANTKDGQTSKKYVERFLDATKSAMLFAKGIILVEGLAEQLLIPCLAEYLKLPLETKHVALVPVGGSTFKHFLPLFGVGCGKGCEIHALNRRVACVVDGDPLRKEKVENARWKKCWPYELDLDQKSYEYQSYSGVVKNLLDMCKDPKDRVIVTYGVKTFEYDLAIQNADSGIIEYGKSGDKVDPKLVTSLAGITNSDDKRKAKIATRYLLAVEGAKGECAFDLARQLKDNLRKMELTTANSPTEVGDHEEDIGTEATNDKGAVIVPGYIKKAIRWACGLDEEEAVG